MNAINFSIGTIDVQRAGLRASESGNCHFAYRQNTADATVAIKHLRTQVQPSGPRLSVRTPRCRVHRCAFTEWCEEQKIELFYIDPGKPGQYGSSPFMSSRRAISRDSRPSRGFCST
jgi:hypothetical protein